LLPKTIMPGAPERINMPVIAPAEVSKVVAAISQGLIDFTKPYAPTTKIQESVMDMINKANKNK